MKPKDVLIIGAGISGCAIALALAKRGVGVAILAADSDQRHHYATYLSQQQVTNQNQISNSESCPRALEQLYSVCKKSVEELLGSEYDQKDVYSSLQEQLKAYSQVEWLRKHTTIELITLDKHSKKRADIYKRPTCCGVYAYHNETKQIEPIFAKETILATGGAASLYLHSTRSSASKGQGLAMAYQAGARIVNSNHIQFYSICLFERGQACFPLPMDLLDVGGKILNINRIPLILEEDLNSQFYNEMLKTKSEHLWLDLTTLDPVEIKNRFPAVDAYCLTHGFNIAKDLLPIVPAVQYINGGVAVDKAAQTTIQRLRALGEVSCTGLFTRERDDISSLLESLTWASAAADDIAKQINKFAYYFPEVIEWNISEGLKEGVIDADKTLLKQALWHYAGIMRDDERLKRVNNMLYKLYELYQSKGRDLGVKERLFMNSLQAGMILLNHRVSAPGPDLFVQVEAGEVGAVN